MFGVVGAVSVVFEEFCLPIVVVTPLLFTFVEVDDVEVVASNATGVPTVVVTFGDKGTLVVEVPLVVEENDALFCSVVVVIRIFASYLLQL